jgi:hypothetical protein
MVAIGFAALLLVGSGGPASAGADPTCCLCASCLPPAFRQCFDSPPAGCDATCDDLFCFFSDEFPGTCNSVPDCAQFVAPAPAPAMQPWGLLAVALVLAGLGLRGMRRRS